MQLIGVDIYVVPPGTTVIIGPGRSVTVTEKTMAMNDRSCWMTEAQYSRLKEFTEEKPDGR